MTQVASLLTVATVFVGLWTLNIYILQLGRGGAYTRDKLLNMQELAGGGGLMCKGGRNSAILQYYMNFVISCTYTIDRKWIWD